MAKVDLTHFRAALKRDPDATAMLKDRTWRRYVTGEFPKNLLWFLRHPEILRALAKDADGWTDDDLELLEALADKRATAQKGVRARQEAKPAPKGRKK